jgi:hypothetical protein
MRELAEVSGVTYGGSLIRPHAQYLRRAGQVTGEGRKILNLIKQAGQELIHYGEIHQETLAAIQRPLVTKEAFLKDWYQS